MPVYNYVRALCADGEVPADDAPAFIVSAVESWLSRQTLSGASAITVGEVADPRLTLLVLHSEPSPEAPEFIHVVVVPDRRLADPSPNALRALFESLYRGRLDRALPKLRAELAGLPYASLAPRILRHFATDADVESLRWSRGLEQRALVADAPSRAATPSRRGSPGWLLPGAVGAGALALLIGVIAGAQMAANLGDRTPTGADAKLHAEIAALEGKLEALATELREDIADRRLVLARAERIAHEAKASPRAETLAEVTREVGQGDDAQAPPLDEAKRPIPARRSVADALSKPRPSATPRVAEAYPALAVTRQLAGEPAEATPELPLAREVAAPSPESIELPSVAASPPTAELPRYRVAVDTARVRSEPSGDGSTRGLLARGTPIVALVQLDDWIEIQPPPGFNAPAWVHASLVEERP